MLGRETVLLPGSLILASTRNGVKWLTERKGELLASGVLAPHSDRRFLIVTAFVKFRSAGEAAAFVTGGAATSARLAWLPIETS